MLQVFFLKTKSKKLEIMKKIKLVLAGALYTFTAYSQTNPVWTNRYNGVGDFSDKFNSVALDATGNVFLTGYSMISGNNTDIITAKLNPSGDTLWLRTFDAKGSGDKGNTIKVDASGNVYVLGTINNGNTNNDIITIKYNSAGDTIWTRTYNNTIVNQDETGVDLTIDASENVYITGNTDNDISAAVNDDYVTVKYNSNGVQQWVKTYDGTGSLGDIPVGVGVDNSGNVYVSGKSFNGVDDDYVTIKYSSLGVQAWLQTYNGISNDRPAAMRTNPAGNTFVTGRSKSTNDDYYTIVYDSSGATLWTAIYDGAGAGNDRPQALTYDSNGNVYVTGQSDVDQTGTTNYDFLTVKYDNAGTPVWTKNYNGAGNNNDIPSDIAIDANGNVYVTGKTDVDASILTNNDYATIKYNSSGIEQWVKTYNGSSNISDGANAIAVDAAGNCVVTGGSEENSSQKDGTTIKYNTTGVQQWIKNYNGEGDNSDNPNAIVADAQGNVYVAGYSFGNGTDQDICVMKINSVGDTAWVRKYDGSAGKTDQAAAIGLDASGNIYVAGYAKNSLTGYDFITIKYNSLGDTIWTKNYNGLGNGTDKANSLFVDASGNIYVTGYSDSDPSLASNDNYVTVKYSSSGTQLWASSYNGGINATDRAYGIVVDANGNVFVTGKSFNGSNYDIVTVKYSSSGVQQNIVTYSGGNGDDVPNAIAIDASANVYITGQTTASNLFDDYTTIKYNSSLTQTWVQTFDGIGSKNDRAYGIAVDGTGNVYVTGQSDSLTSQLLKNYDYLTIKYNSAGTQQWTKSYNGESNTNDAAVAIALDPSGNIYVTGQSENGTSSFPNKDFVTIKYNPLGDTVWTSKYNGTGNGTDGANAVAVVGSSVYVTGGSIGLNSQKDIVTLKYDTLPLSVGINKKENLVVTISPNPFCYTTLISFPIQEQNPHLSFEMFNLAGQKIDVSHAINTSNNKTEIRVTRNNLANGIYFYKITSEGNLINTGKIIID